MSGCPEHGNATWCSWCSGCVAANRPTEADRFRAENAELRARAESAEAQIAKLRREASATLIDDFTGQQSRDNRKLRDENADLRRQLREKTDDLAEVLRGCEKLRAQLDAATVREAAGLSSPSTDFLLKARAWADARVNPSMSIKAVADLESLAIAARRWEKEGKS